MFYQATEDYRIFEKEVPKTGSIEGRAILFIPAASDITLTPFFTAAILGREYVHLWVAHRILPLCPPPFTTAAKFAHTRRCSRFHR